MREDGYHGDARAVFELVFTVRQPPENEEERGQCGESECARACESESEVCAG